MRLFASLKETLTKADSETSAGFAEASPLQRIWRDAAVASRHAVVLPAVGYELYGKALLGVKNDVTPLI